MGLIFVVMCGLFAVGIPIAWSMAISAGVFMTFVLSIPIEALPHRIMGGLDSFPLLAIPFFIFAGNLMNTGGITRRLVNFSSVLVGHITGGLGHVVVVANMIMAGMSGSGIADCADTSNGSSRVPKAVCCSDCRCRCYNRSYNTAEYSFCSLWLDGQRFHRPPFASWCSAWLLNGFNVDDF